MASARRDLDSTLQDRVRDIRKVCSNKTDFAGPPTYQTLWDYGISRQLFPGTNRIVELEELCFRRNVSPGAKGAYNHEHKRIFLKRGNWCLKTLIHETLHALSHFAREPRVGNRYLPLCEGLNEFMTGYVLWKVAPECYDSWRCKLNRVCALDAYEPDVKTWYALCHFISFEEIKKVHFGDPNKRWNQIWQDFCRKIPKRDNRRFSVPLDGQLQNRFHSECKAHFEDFERIYEMESSTLNYDILKYDS